MSDVPQSEEERAALNQSLFRDVNERVQDIAERFGSTVTDFACECDAETCLEHVPLTLDEYESVRAAPARFFVKPGHVRESVERVVEAASDRYHVVVKVGHAGQVATEHDPRSDSAS